MTKEEKIFEIAKAIAPVFAMEGVNLQHKIINNGGDPEKCLIDGKNILHAYGLSLKLWATAFVEELEKEEQSE